MFCPPRIGRQMRSSPSSRVTWTVNWWPNEAGRVNWISSGKSSRRHSRCSDKNYPRLGRSWRIKAQSWRRETLSSRRPPKGWRLQTGWTKASKLSSTARGASSRARMMALCVSWSRLADKAEAEKQADTTMGHNANHLGTLSGLGASAPTKRRFGLS